MNRFFVPLSAINGDTAIIEGQDAKHIGFSLRSAVGDKIYICDGTGFDYLCEILAITKTEVSVKILSKEQNENESQLKTTLYVALPKGDKMELITQKSVELGVYCIRPFISTNCISRPDDKALAKKIVRWQAISESAAKQCGRGIIPTVYPCITFEQAMMQASTYDECLFFYEATKEKALKPEIAKKKNIAIITGPEGGFTQNEVDFALKNGCKIATLGKRILRCETAPLVALAILSYFDNI